MQSSIVDITAYGLFWLMFGLTHSIMASEKFKAPWRRFLGPLAYCERLIYNGISMVAIAAVFTYANENLAMEPLFQPQGVIKWLFWLLQGLGFVLLIWSLSTYDLLRFAGLRQIYAGITKQKIAPEPLVISKLHCFVRHPIYSSVLLLLWFRPQNEAMFITNIFATLYLFIGMSWEDKRLKALYGEDYQQYCQAVPAIVPHPKRRWQAKATEK
ncbi:MAG: hypothetical protein HQL69_11055 [Magnetococcales bacterium]|nr:hypothetical protein [Magnetococcales bacterium]